MLNVYKVEYKVTYIREREILAKTEQEAVLNVAEELSWEKPHAMEILSSAFIEEHEPADLTHLHAIADNMRKCAHERNPSNIAEMHECACRKAAEKHE